MSEKQELSVFKNLLGGALIESKEEKEAMDRMSQSTTFIPRLQLYTRGKAVDKELISGGHFGIPRQGDTIDDLGKSINVLVLKRKPKALDMSDRDNLIESNDPTSEEFKRIENMADNVKDSQCVYGTAYLCWERSTRSFLEFFCGSKSSRIESAQINRYLPSENEGSPKPMTLKGTLVENARFSWHVPKAEESLVTWDESNLFTKEQLERAVELFTKAPESSEVETVEKKKGGRRR